MWFTSLQTPTTSNLKREISIVSIYAHYTIYKITNLINNKVYIGQTIRKLQYRWTQHLYSSKKDPTTPIYYAMKKYGVENFKIEPIVSCFDLNELNLMETHFILEYRSNDSNFGYNCNTGGKNQIPNEETREKHRIASKGERNPNYGKKTSEEAKRKRAEHMPDQSGPNHINYGKTFVELYGEERAKEIARKIRENTPILKGLDRPASDKTKYHFVHKSGITEFCACCELTEKYNLIKGIDAVKRKKRNYHKGWSIIWNN